MRWKVIGSEPYASLWLKRSTGDGETTYSAEVNIEIDYAPDL